MGSQVCSIRLNEANTVTGTLPDGKHLAVVVDSGATLTVLSSMFVDSSDYLRKLPREKTKVCKIRIADGSIVECSEMIRFSIKIQNYTFSIAAQVMPTYGLVSCLLGTADLKRLRAQLDFSSNTLRFRIPDHSAFKVVESGWVRPHAIRTVTLQCKLPKNANFGQIVMNCTALGRSLTSGCLVTGIRRGYCQVQIYNSSSRSVRLERGSVFGYLDALASHSKLQPVRLTKITQIAPDQKQNCFHHRPLNQFDRDALARRNLKLYPFLEESDPNVCLTDEEILERDLDLQSNSVLDSAGHSELGNILFNHKSAFSLRGETGNCDYEVKLELLNEEPFNIRPYTVSEEEKRLIDRELNRLVKMGVLRQGIASSCSPVMLVKKKGGAKRVVADLRFLNSRIRKRHWPFPLVRDTVQQLGASNCSVMSTIDLKDAFHSLKLHRDSQRHVGITSYNGGKSYYYLRLPMGASLSPSEFQQYIQSVLDTVPGANRFVIAHMDDLIIFSKSIQEHFDHLDSLLDALERHGLKISPKKAQFFKSRLEYMGHVILVNEGRPQITPMMNKCEAIQRLQPPRNSREVKSIIGAVTYLSMYLPRLQELLIPMHKLSNPRADFIWSEECQKNFREIKALLVKPPVLAMPSPKGQFKLYSDTSRYATGASLCQVVNGEERLLGYHSKSLPDAAKRYSVSELEFYGLYQNILAFKNILRGTHFDAIVDHSALVYIMKSKREPPTNRMQKLIELLSDYSFDLYYKKGAEMVICDLLSRMCAPSRDDPLMDPSPIACTCEQPIEEVSVLDAEPTRRVTRSFAKQNGIQIPPATGKSLDFSKPEKPASATQECLIPQSPVTSVQSRQAPDHTTQLPVISDTLGRAPASTPSQSSIPYIPSSIQAPASTPRLSDIPYTPSSVPSSPPNLRPRSSFSGPRDPVRSNTLIQGRLQSGKRPPIMGLIPRQEASSDSGRDFQELYRPADEYIIRDNEPLMTQIKYDQIGSKHIPRQQEIDKHLAEIRKRCLSDFNVPLKTAELKREYNSSPFFRHVYSYLTNGLLPAGKKLARSILVRAEEFVLVNGILFRISFRESQENFNLVLAVPESLAEYLISQYHDGLMACHQGVSRTYQTMRQKFFIPNLYGRLVEYIKSCEVCQQRKIPQDRDNGHQYQPRIFSGYSPFSEIHTDIKHMFPAYDGSQYLLVVTCVQTRFVVAIPLKSMDCTSVAEAILQRVVFTYGVPKRIVSDLGKSFANKVFEYLMKSLNIEGTYVSPENHGSLVAERSIQSIARLLLSQLEDHGKSWPLYIQAVCYAYNTFSHVLLGGYSPFEMVYGRPPPDHSNINVVPADEVPTNYEDYVNRLKKRFETIGSTVIKLHNYNQEHQSLVRGAALRKQVTYRVGQLVYFLMPSHSNLQTNTRKFTVHYIGPVKIREILDPTHLILEDLNGRLIAGVHHIKRIKPAHIRGLDPEASELTRNRHSTETGLHVQFTLDKGKTVNSDLDSISCKISGVPEEEEEVRLTKSRYKDGEHQVLFATDNGEWNMWYTVSDHPSLASVVNPDKIIRTTGSRRKWDNIIS